MTEYGMNIATDDRRYLIGEIEKRLDRSGDDEINAIRKFLAKQYQDDDLLTYERYDLAVAVYDDWSEESFSDDYETGVKSVDAFLDLYRESVEKEEEEGEKEREEEAFYFWKVCGGSWYAYNGVSQRDFL